MQSALFIGRFQPFHRGHAKIARLALAQMNDIVVGLVQGEQSSMDTQRNPFPIELRKKLITAGMQEVWPKFESHRIMVLPDAFISTPINAFRPEFEIRQLWCGADRGKMYQSMLPYARVMGATI